MILYFLLLSLSAIFFFLILNQKRLVKKSFLPPGPPCLPFIGNLLQFDTASPHLYLWKLAKKYGPLMSMKLGSRPVLVVSSAKMAKEVLKTHDLTFSSRPEFLGLQKLSYSGLDVAFAPYGESWRETRKICVLHLLSNKQVQSFTPVREDEVFCMIRRISDLARSNHDNLTNLSEIVLSFTSSLICRIAFGKKFDDQEGSEVKKFDELMYEAQAMQGGLFVSDYLPSFSWVDKLSGMATRLEKTFQKLDSFYQELIDEHLKPNSSKSMNKDILDILIQLKEEQSSSLELTLDHIKAVLMNIFVAGTDTSAATIIWAMTSLIKTPNAMKKVQEEIRDRVGHKGRVDEDDLGKLPYLKAVIKEILRLYPPAPLLLPRETMKSCVLEGYEIQPKTLVYINACAIARDPEYWENPIEFCPERFLNSSVDVKGQDFELIPFGSGRRNCPGMSLGLATVELGLANLLYSFDWELPRGVKAEDIDTDVLPGITMHKKNALCLVPRNYLCT